MKNPHHTLEPRETRKSCNFLNKPLKLVRLREEKRTPGCWDYIATKRKSEIFLFLRRNSSRNLCALTSFLSGRMYFQWFLFSFEIIVNKPIQDLLRNNLSNTEL